MQNYEIKSIVNCTFEMSTFHFLWKACVVHFALKMSNLNIQKNKRSEQ